MYPPPGTAPQLSLVVPSYQESDGLATALGQIQQAAAGTGLSFEIILVDDGSTDDTWRVATAMKASTPELVALRLSRNFGKEAAICAGLDAATGSACIVLDADLQHPPALIPDMVRLWQAEGWDIVEAVKNTRGSEAPLHRWTTRAFYRAASWMTGFNMQDASDFKLLDRRVLDEWRRFGERSTFFRGLVAWLGFRRTEILFDVAPRQSGRSRWSVTALTGLAVRAVTSFSALPLQIVTVLGGIMFLVAVVLGVQALRLWMAQRALPGITTVVLLQLMTGGVLMMSLGIIGAYIARIYDEVKGRPRYVVRDRL